MTAYIGLWETDTFFTTTYRAMGTILVNMSSLTVDGGARTFDESVVGNIMGPFNYRVRYSVNLRSGFYTEQTRNTNTQSPRVR